MEHGVVMCIPIHPDLEIKISARAEAGRLSVEAYLERLVQADLQGMEELEALALEGLESGVPLEAGPAYRQEKHRQLDEHLKKTETQ